MSPVSGFYFGYFYYGTACGDAVGSA